MTKHPARHQKVAVGHCRAAAPRRSHKAIPVNKPASAKPPVPAFAAIREPKPRFIEVLEMDFTDPDITLDEEPVVTGFEDEDL